MKRKWVKNISKETLDEMIPEKLDTSFKRPSFLDVLAEQVMVVSQRSACLFYNIGAVIFRGDQVLSFGYNGPSSGDFHCYEVGCNRMVDGKLLNRGSKGSGLCRGSHAELNAIGNAAKNGVRIEGAAMMVAFRPCFMCAKHIVNQGIKEVYYIFDYDGDVEAKKYLERLGVKLVYYKSDILKNWMKKNGVYFPKK